MNYFEVNMLIWGLVKIYEILYLEGMNMHKQLLY